MAYRLTRRGSISHQLRRLVRKELKQTLGLLGTARPGEDAIHEARKGVKKLRAVLRLVRASLGSAYHRENRRLRLAAHALAALRDADASAETLEMLRRRYPSLITSAAAGTVARGLRSRKRRVRAHAARRLGQARGALERAAESTPESIAAAAHLRTIKSGMLRGYRRARSALKDLDLDSGAARFHLWRRRLKDHWYQVRLFEGLHPAPGQKVRALKQLEQLLGDDHNLSMLRSIILVAPARYGNAHTTALVLGCIARSQATLRTRALRLGHRVFAERPLEFKRGVAQW